MSDSTASDKILVFGIAGFLAERAEMYFNGRASISGVDILDLVALEQEIISQQPGVVINAAAMTNTHEIEKPENRNYAYQVNVQGAAHLAYLAHKHGFHMVHLSTGMFFDGKGPNGNGFREEDLPDPDSYYSWTKAWADAQIVPFADRDKILVLRIQLPLSRFGHPKNFVNKLRTFDKGIDIPTSVTIMEDLFMAMERLLADGRTGLYHVVNPGVISAYEIMTIMQKHGLIDPAKEIIRMTREELEAQVAAKGGARQTFSYLNSDKLREAGVELPEIHQAVEDLIINYKETP